MAKELAEQVSERLVALSMSKAQLAVTMGCSRPMLSQYLNGKYQSDASDLEDSLSDWLKKTAQINPNCANEDDAKVNEKVECFESDDYVNVLGICSACQEHQALGIVVGKSGFGKSYTLKQYAKIQRVIYIECNETMSCRDLIRRIETQINLPKIYGSNDERLERIIDFFNINSGYLLIIDEADKLINKYTIKKIELLRNIADGARVGMVIAGEPALESYIKGYDVRFANRMDFYFKLHGLTNKEIVKYLDQFDVDAVAIEILTSRANNSTNGCFRLFDRTINNVLRVLRNKNTDHITTKIIDEASSMMML